VTPTVTGTPSITGTSTSTPISTPSARVDLGTSYLYGVLANTFTSNGGITTIAGDAGYTTLSGSGTHVVTGVNRMPPPDKAGLDQNAALATLNGMACTFSFAIGDVDLASDTTHGSLGIYTPGVYCIDGAMNILGGVAGI